MIFLELALKWFEMDMQSKGTNINVSGSIDPAGHGSEKLNDGIYWYQYWSTYSPAVISVEHKTESHMNVKGINLFLVGEPDDLSIRVLCKDEHGQMKQLYPGGASTLHPVRKIPPVLILLLYCPLPLINCCILNAWRSISKQTIEL